MYNLQSKTFRRKNIPYATKENNKRVPVIDRKVRKFPSKMSLQLGFEGWLGASKVWGGSDLGREDFWLEPKSRMKMEISRNTPSQGSQLGTSNISCSGREDSGAPVTHPLNTLDWADGSPSASTPGLLLMTLSSAAARALSLALPISFFWSWWGLLHHMGNLLWFISSSKPQVLVAFICVSSSPASKGARTWERL